MSSDSGTTSDGDRKTYIADSARAFGQRRIGKRAFLRRLAAAGVGLSSFATAMLGGNRPFPGEIGTRALARDDADGLFVVQARPVTGLAKKPDKPKPASAMSLIMSTFGAGPPKD